jgi:hypothetical protein
VGTGQHILYSLIILFIFRALHHYFSNVYQYLNPKVLLLPRDALGKSTTVLIVMSTVYFIPSFPLAFISDIFEIIKNAELEF